MNDIWDSFKKLFKAAEKSSATKPFIHELIERSTEELRDFEKWKHTFVKRRLLDWLNNQYVNFIINPEHTDEAVDFLNTTSAKGFIIHLDKTGYTSRESIYLLDYFKEKVLALNYKSYVSDSKTYSNINWVETKQRHYLKPKTSFSYEGKSAQAFGNITIELLLRNEQSVNLKFRVNSYMDRKFEAAKDFGELIQGILK